MRPALRVEAMGAVRRGAGSQHGTYTGFFVSVVWGGIPGRTAGWMVVVRVIGVSVLLVGWWRGSLGGGTVLELWLGAGRLSRRSKRAATLLGRAAAVTAACASLIVTAQVGVCGGFGC